MISKTDAFTILFKYELKKIAARVVILEVLLSIFNSYCYEEGETVQASFAFEDLKIVHRFFVNEYGKAKTDFINLNSQERNQILNTFISKWDNYNK